MIVSRSSSSRASCRHGVMTSRNVSSSVRIRAEPVWSTSGTTSVAIWTAARAHRWRPARNRAPRAPREGGQRCSEPCQPDDLVGPLISRPPGRIRDRVAVQVVAVTRETAGGPDSVWGNNRARPPASVSGGSSLAVWREGGVSASGEGLTAADRSTARPPATSVTSRLPSPRSGRSARR